MRYGLRSHRYARRRTLEARPEIPVDVGRVLVGRLSWLSGEGDSGESSSLQAAADGPPGRGGVVARRPRNTLSPAPRGFLAGSLDGGAAA